MDESNAVLNELEELICPKNKCCTVGNQYADVSVPIEIEPKIEVGEIKTECCGEPMVRCKNCSSEKCCIEIVQKISIQIPICYRISAVAKETSIACVKPYPLCDE